jgi:hypothetical protein
MVAGPQKKSTRSRAEGGESSLLVKKPAARRSAKSEEAEVQSPSIEKELDRIASSDVASAMAEVETEISQPIPAAEPQYYPRSISSADRANLDRKYGHRGTSVAFDVLIGRVANQQMIALENLFFYAARVFIFRLGDKEFFVNPIQDSSGSDDGRLPIILSCAKGKAQVLLESLGDLSTFAPELSKFSIGSYPAPVQNMLINSLLSPLLDRLSTLLSAKVDMRLAEAPQSFPGPQFSLSVRIYDGNPYEGKEVGLLLSAKVSMDLPLAEEFGKLIQQVPSAILRTFPVPFRYENRVAETGISREDLASLRLGDVILLDNTAAIETKQTRLLGPCPYEFACTGNGNKLTITGICEAPV